MSDAIGINSQGFICEITIRRPHALNALDAESLVALRNAFVQARDDQMIRVIILTGEGPRAFCAGADMKRTLPPATSFAEAFWLSDSHAIERGSYIRGFDLTKLDLWKPIIAAINGYCLGGGLELAMQCDIRVAAETATFGLPEARIGSIPAVGGLQRLLRSVPTAVAMKLALSGEPISAQEALRVALVSDVWPASELLESARGLARRIADNAPLAVQAIKRLSVVGTQVPLRDALLFEEMTWGILRDTADRIEGRRAFAERRKPKFEGR